MTTQELRSRPRQERSGATIDALLDAADAVFERVGFADASTVSIAQQAGMSVGRLYYWFHDKEAIAAALSQRHQARLGEFLTEQLTDLTGVPTPTMVSTMIGGLADFFATNRGAIALLRRGSPAPGMRRLMTDLVAGLVATRVPTSTEAEQHLVAVILVDVVLVTLDTALAGADVASQQVRDELAYLVAAYLYARYPSEHDPVWTSADHPIRPARQPSTSAVSNATIKPVMP